DHGTGRRRGPGAVGRGGAGCGGVADGGAAASGAGVPGVAASGGGVPGVAASGGVGWEAGGFGEAAVARTEPVRMSAKATRTVTVRASSRKTVPAATAIAGWTWVITEARIGPASLISSRKATKATAEIGRAHV